MPCPYCGKRNGEKNAARWRESKVKNADETSAVRNVNGDSCGDGYR